MTEVLERRELRHQRTREDILQAAWELAERDGIAALSLRDLAARVGMRAPSLYTYFDSKDAIYDALFAQAYRLFQQEQEAWAEETAGMDREAAIVHHLERWLDFCQVSIPRYQLMYTNVVAGWEPSPEAYEVSRASYARMVQLLTSWGIEGERALDLFTALNAGLAAQQVANDPGGERWIRLVPDVTRMFLSHIDSDTHEETAR